MNTETLNDGTQFGKWFTDRTFASMRKSLEPLRGTSLTLMELFGGLSTGFIALAALGMHPVLRIYCDINDDLLHWVSQLHSNPGSVHCGPRAGNILLKCIESLPRVMVIIAGPPCPPWSSKGARKSWEDSRSVPFWRTLHIVVEQARSGTLLFFVIENVKGFTQRQLDGTVPLEEVMQLLIDELPEDWIVDWFIYNTKDFGLPHNRPRVYLVGRKSSPGSLHRFPHNVNCFERKPFVADVVKQVMTGSLAVGYRGSGYSPLQRSNLRQWRNALCSQLRQKSMRGHCIFFAYDRTPSSRTNWKPSMSNETCECLTASGPMLHCFSLGDIAKSRDSSVLPSERAALQGFPLEYIVDDHRHLEATKAVGNSMSVPVVASVCFRELLYQLELRPLHLLSFIASLPRHVLRLLVMHEYS